MFIVDDKFQTMKMHQTSWWSTFWDSERIGRGEYRNKASSASSMPTCSSTEVKFSPMIRTREFEWPFRKTFVICYNTTTHFIFNMHLIQWDGESVKNNQWKYQQTMTNAKRVYAYFAVGLKRSFKTKTITSLSEHPN